MSKVDTDQGLGPGSERKRRDLLESGKQKAAPIAVDKNAVTEPGVGKVERKNDTVDDLLGGFGASRPDLPRILPKADTTPPPEPVKKELTPTEPGKRQRVRNIILATVLTFAIVAIVGLLLVKLGQSTAKTTPSTTTTTTTSTSTIQTASTIDTTSAQPTVAPITTMSVDALPTVAKTNVTPPTVKSVHSANTSSAPTTTTAATAPHPTGSAPPGMNLLPDDPHR